MHMTPGQKYVLDQKTLNIKQFLAAKKSCYCLRNQRVLEISDPKHPTFQLFDKDERISYLETKVAQQQQNLQLFKTMLQQKEVYVMDLEDEVNNPIIFYFFKTLVL